MVTPFDQRGELDLDAAASLARWLVGHGSEGLVVAGSTGEGTVLSDDEKLSLWRSVAEAVTVPVIAATGSNDTRHSIELTARAADLGVAGVLVVTPYYSRPSQQGLLEHFRAVAGATELPVILYDVPIRSGRRIATDVMVRLVKDVGNIVALKDSVRDPESSARLLNLVPSSFELYCGDDSLTLPLLSIGAVGVISVASHWIGRELHAVVAAFLKGDVEGAFLANRRLIESYDFEATERISRTPCPPRRRAGCRDWRSATAERRMAPPRPSSTARPGACWCGQAFRLPDAPPRTDRRPTGASGRSAPRGGASGRSAAVGPPRAVGRTAPRAGAAEKRPAPATPVRIVFLGGLGEIGRNCACIEVDGRILVLDCGIMFPDPDMPGVDLVLPDFTYLRENARIGSTGSSSPTATRTTRAGWPTSCATSRSPSTARR